MVRDTEKHTGRSQCDNRGRDRRDVSTSQGSPGKLGKGKEGSFSRAFRENMALLASWFWTSGLQHRRFLNICTCTCAPLNLPLYWLVRNTIHEAMFVWLDEECLSPPGTFISFIISSQNPSQSLAHTRDLIHVCCMNAECSVSSVTRIHLFWYALGL